jgi:hypothetical protein
VLVLTLLFNRHSLLDEQAEQRRCVTIWYETTAHGGCHSAFECDGRSALGYYWPLHTAGANPYYLGRYPGVEDEQNPTAITTMAIGILDKTTVVPSGWNHSHIIITTGLINGNAQDR